MSMSRKTILYVEDEQWLMEGITDSLSVNYNVIKARSGDQALAILESAKQKVDLILLDIMMPEGKRVQTPDRGRTSGVKFAHIILEEMKLKIPIVCYTVSNNPDAHRELLTIGVKEIVPKTKLPSELGEIIKKYL